MTLLALLAHGVGGRGDLPLPAWLFIDVAVAAVLVSFLILRLAWHRPHLAALADGRRLAKSGRGARLALRTLGLAALLLVLAAGWWGTTETEENLAPVAVYILFWVGVPILSAVVGNVWAWLNPLDTLALVLEPLRRNRQPSSVGPEWTAAALLFSFVWLELAYHDPSSPRAIALYLSIYIAASLAGAGVWGRPWLRRGEGLTVLFELIAHVAPLTRDAEGRLRLRPPITGLAGLTMTAGRAAVILVALGSTTFDGLSRTSFWRDLAGSRTGWELTALNTLGLVWLIAIVVLAYVGATRVAAAMVGEDDRSMALTFAASLVPIALAYSVAHYFSLLVFEGQGIFALVSDPLGRGWDLFGTEDRRVDYRVVSTATIAYVQASAIAIGHVAGVVVAHDVAVARFGWRRGSQSQYALVGVMMLYTVAGLTLLLGA